MIRQPQEKITGLNSADGTQEQKRRTRNANMSDPDTLFTLDRTDVLNAWGDYGSMLGNGLCLSRWCDLPLRLARTGPFVPPISFPLASKLVVVTDSIKERLEAGGLKGVGEFQRVILEKVVSIPWENWDWQNRVPGELLPYNGEPEEYILHNPHNEEAAAKVGALWTWHPEQVGTVVRSDGPLRLEGLSNLDREVFCLSDTGYRSIFVTERGRSVLEEILGDWVSFKPVEVPWS